jgi:hypothetical protein
MPIGMQPSAPARVERLMINLDTCLPMTCAWDTCDRRARTPYQIRMHEHPPTRQWCRVGRHSHYVFCSDTCLLYWARSSGADAHETAARHGGRIYGNLHPGDPRRYR